MSVRRWGRRELRREKKEIVFQEKVGKQVAMHGGARLSVGFMLPHQARIICAGEPAITVDAHE
eukprot:1069140-Prorocentrum_lima.AAC.1